MSDKRHMYPVTVVREVFTPTPEVQDAIQGFFRTNSDSQKRLANGLYATSQRLLDTRQHRFHRYDGELQDAKRALARRRKTGESLRLTGQTNIRTYQDGTSRLYVQVADQGLFDETVDEMSGIGDVGEQLAAYNCLYIDVAKDGLARTVQERRDAVASMVYRAHHTRRMSVSNPQIVERDVPAYPLAQPLPVRRVTTYEEDVV